MIFLEPEIEKEILNSYDSVYNGLGWGFPEKVYENALIIELKKRGMVVETQKCMRAYYDGYDVGQFILDMVVEDKVIIELKAVSDILDVHKAQVINYLKVSNYPVGYLLNFGQVYRFERLLRPDVFGNKRKISCFS